MIKKGKEERRKEANGFRIRVRSKLSTVPSASGIGGVKIPCSRYVTYSSEVSQNSKSHRLNPFA